ncbi:hypothetical protein FBU30_001785 [Linnemannia zychae]|nr:hypothetical protein FBU30_001785 [Linnemannia zychae]
MQQTAARPLIAEIDQLRRSVDSMNSQTAEMLKNLEHLQHLGADHITLPSVEQEKLDREWEYFETVCDQVFFILENAKYKLKRQQNIYYQQLNPPNVESAPVTPPNEVAPVTSSIATTPANTTTTTTPVITAHTATTPVANATPQLSAGTTPTGPVTGTGMTGTPNMASAAAVAAATGPGTPSQIVSPAPAAIGMVPQNINSPLDLQMLSPPSTFDINSSTPGIGNNGGVATPSMLLSAAAQDINLGGIGDSSFDPTLEIDGTVNSMLDLGDISSLGNGDMDDMINF